MRRKPKESSLQDVHENIQAMSKKSRRRKAELELTVRMVKLKETKGAYQYGPVDDDDNPIEDYKETTVGAIYIRKSVFDDVDAPEYIEVTVTAA